MALELPQRPAARAPFSPRMSRPGRAAPGRSDGPHPGNRGLAGVRRRLAEQARVVRDHAVHAERLQRPDPRGVVHGPDVELSTGGVYRVDEAPAHEDLVAHDRLTAARPDARGRLAWKTGSH